MRLIDRWRKYRSCRRCHGTGYIKVETPIPRSEWNAREVAEIMLLGGYVVKVHIVECGHS